MIIIRTIEELEAEWERQHKKWIKAKKDEDYFYVKLNRADLRGAKLMEVSLCNAAFSRANLSGAILTNAFLREAFFENANLTKANLTGANLFLAYFCKANLTEADLRGAKLTSAYLEGAKIKNTIITQSQWDKLAKLYSQEFMAGFLVKGLYD